MYHAQAKGHVALWDAKLRILLIVFVSSDLGRESPIRQFAYAYSQLNLELQDASLMFLVRER